MREKLTFVARLAVGAIFIYAAYIKFTMPWLTFAMSVDAYQILPDWGVFLVARLLPGFELLIGLLLVSGFGLRWSSPVVNVLLGVFLAAMFRAYLQGKSIDCGCFGPGDRLGVGSLVRDSSILAVSLFVTISAFLPAKRRLQ
jgi:uncharacterized membrane protein YphA (DoxX/SURF4 family)